MLMLPMVRGTVQGVDWYTVQGPAGQVAYAPAGNILEVRASGSEPRRLPEVDADRADGALRQYGNAGLRLYLNRWYETMAALRDDGS